MKILNALLLAALLAGGAAAAEKAAAPGKDAWKKKVFTAEELKKYDGQEGRPAYVAVDGIVYDLSGSKYWKTGTHMKRHPAGADLSRELHEQAPKSIHRDGKILGRMPKVGVTEDYGKEKGAAGKTAPAKELKKSK